MGLYGENDKQGQYWNEQPGQSWVIHDAAMNERLQTISDILLKIWKFWIVKMGWILDVAQVQQQYDCIKYLAKKDKLLGLISPENY